MGKTEPAESRRFPARLHVLLARRSRQALVIRRGPAKAVCTVGWDRSDDSFAMGQWLRGRIYERRCDLSPDGRHFIYFAMNGRWQSRATGGSWSAISRTPYLKAVALWAKGDCWNGGGLFLSNSEFWLNGGHDVLEPPPVRLHQAAKSPARPPHGNNECLGVYFIRLLRDGWTQTCADEIHKWHSVVTFEKPINAHWTLRKRATGKIHESGDRQGRGVYFDEHDLVHAGSGEVLAKPGWEWAEVDGRRLVWAEAGCLYAGTVDKDGLGAQRRLRDLNCMNFEPLAAPY